MPKTYTPAPQEIVNHIEAVKQKWHQRLESAGVTISALMVSGGLTHQGYSALAVVKINSLKDRVEGKADCTIDFDEEAYAQWPESKLRAIIDHELEHLQLQTHKKGARTGEVKTDDCGRPLLKMKLHDLVLGGFECIIARHQENAVEAQIIAACVDCLPDALRPFDGGAPTSSATEETR